jgi:RES domain-containing protein
MKHLPKPPQLWRISNRRSLAGEGGLRYSARWHTAGHRIVYLAESPAAALLEILVRLELRNSDLPGSYNLMRVTFPANMKIEPLRLPEDNSWNHNPAISQAIGDAWLRSGASALAEVPSAIMPSTRSYLLNPDHPNADQIQIAEFMVADFDPRLLRKVRS